VVFKLGEGFIKAFQHIVFFGKGLDLIKPAG
jgi:hypothetical protein